MLLRPRRRRLQRDRSIVCKQINARDRVDMAGCGGGGGSVRGGQCEVHGVCARDHEREYSVREIALRGVRSPNCDGGSGPLTGT